MFPLDVGVLKKGWMEKELMEKRDYLGIENVGK